MPYFSARLDFPSPPLSAPGSPRMDEELIFQEDSEKEISRSAANISYDNVLARFIDACSPDDQFQEHGTNKDQRVNRIMEWK